MLGHLASALQKACLPPLLLFGCTCQRTDSTTEQHRSTPQSSASVVEPRQAADSAKPPTDSHEAKDDSSFGGLKRWPGKKPWPAVNQERGRSPSLGCDVALEIKQAVKRLRTLAFRYQRCGEEHVLITPGGRMPTRLEAATTDTSEIKELYGVLGSRWGTCCRSNPKRFSHMCFNVDLLPCSSPLDAVAEALQSAVQRQLPLIQAAMSIHIPALKPRCGQPDSGCVAVPYERAANPIAGARQVVGPSRATSCAHDGDCTTAGCGNECVSWPFAWVEGRCDLRSELSEASCGCVDGLCNWFTQRSPSSR